ncbi:LamG domain-containing protein [Verrucosispora sp. NA02020]|uniref:LamG domain-containing protein n=1 Tax=Verrucosispora sp. NA02020 TaxID=2742132 RepID=UPI00158FD0DB|nr:LamG domain-containing protein [Verrucosispora sp. NA02020]QKW13694.1 LamG domain-containing protein [Verrucosispora sp. NA02020]
MSPEPLLFWQLDDIAPGNVVVDYGKGQLDGRLEGNPTVSPDDQFGAVLTLDGVGDAVVSPATLPPYTTYTMCGWFRVPTQTSGMQTLMGRDLYGVHVNVLGRIMADLPGTNVRYSSGAGLFTYDTWHHLAVTRGTTLLRIHLDGVVVLEANVGAPPTVQSSFVVGRPPGNASQYQPMSVAAVRLYGTALSAAEVTELMAVDESPVTSFVRTHPLDFELANVDQQPVLYIDDAATSQTLTLRVTNSSRHDITLWPLSGAPSVTNRHLTLSLRPGTIAPASTVGLAASGWALAANEARTELYLRGPANAVVPAAASVELPLTGLRADGTDGTRVTRVELAYQRLGYTGETSEIVGTRQQSLEVVNHRGRPDIPLDVAFVGGNRVLSDGSGTSSLRLRVANVSRRVAIALAGSATVGKERASALVLSFDVQLANETRDWALTTAGQVGAVQVALSGATGVAWDVDKMIDDERAMWTLTPKQDTTIAAEEWLELGIGPVHGLTTPGHAPVVLSYRNVPGFQDGFVSVDVERSPLLFTGTQVALGAGTASAKLHLFDRFTDANGGSLIVGPTNAPNLRLGYDRTYSWVQSHSGAPLAINPIGNNVAVGGTAAPFKLTVRAATEHLQLRREGQTGGNQIYLELYQSETPADVTTYPSIRFHHAGKFWHRLECRPDGFMFKWGPPTSDDLSDIFARLGVFTSMRVDKVAVSGGEGHLRVERRDQAAGKQVFLELFQADVPANQGTFPSLRFHHANKFWHRIEGRPEGFLFKDGNTGSDELRDIFARTASFTSLRLGSTGIGESDLRRLLDLARHFPF